MGGFSNTIAAFENNKHNHAMMWGVGGPREKSQGRERNYGGAKRDRTADLLHAMQALSQLSYSPIKTVLNVLFVLVQVRRVQIGVNVVFVSWYKVVVGNVNIVNVHGNVGFG